MSDEVIFVEEKTLDRVKLMSVPLAMLMEVLQGTVKILDNDVLPKEVVQLGVNYDHEYRSFMVTLHSDEWDRVPHGQKMDVLFPDWYRTPKEDKDDE
jgi:hypothetical protein